MLSKRGAQNMVLAGLELSFTCLQHPEYRFKWAGGESLLCMKNNTLVYLPVEMSATDIANAHKIMESIIANLIARVKLDGKQS